MIGNNFSLSLNENSCYFYSAKYWRIWPVACAIYTLDWYYFAPNDENCEAFAPKSRLLWDSLPVPPPAVIIYAYRIFTILVLSCVLSVTVRRAADAASLTNAFLSADLLSSIWISASIDYSEIPPAETTLSKHSLIAVMPFLATWDLRFSQHFIRAFIVLVVFICWL